MPRFDGYSATAVGVQAGVLVGLLQRAGDNVRSGRGFHTFKERVSVSDGTCEVGAVQFGGEVQGQRVMFEVKGDRTPEVVEQFRGLVGEHRCTRVDSCEDFEAPGVWDEHLAVVMDVKKRYGLYGERAGDWDMPEFGRTQYVGAPSSPSRFRLYEKGKQPEYRHLGRVDLVRAELQVRPAKDAKAVYSTVTPSQVWGASPFTRELAARLLQCEVSRLAVGTLYRESNRDRALRWMCMQYGPHLMSLREDLGDWECVGKTLGEMLRARRRH